MRECGSAGGAILRVGVSAASWTLVQGAPERLWHGQYRDEIQIGYPGHLSAVCDATNTRAGFKGA